jgi:probable rRNA maturation factor
MQGKLVILRKRITGLSTSTLERFVRRARRAVRLRNNVNILLTSSSDLRALNRRFLGKDKTTDVLSFPSPPAIGRQARSVAGEIAISLDIARENASHLGHSLAEEVKILVLHGILHLAGFDHERDNGKMAVEEARLRERLNLVTGLIERSRVPALRPGSRKRAQPPAGRRTA